MTFVLSTDTTVWEAWIQTHTLIFKGPAGTSRGTLTQKPVSYICLKDTSTGTIGIGECSTLQGLSPEHGTGYNQALLDLAEAINNGDQSLEAAYQAFQGWPSVQFGLEQAYLDWLNGGQRILFDTAYTRGTEGIPINGLIWMNNIPTMRQAINEKLDQGYRCLKLKVGARNWDEEYQLIQEVRSQYSASELEIRVDANGAFREDDAYSKLQQLEKLEVHSIEQPLPANAWEATAELCEQAPVPVALDEGLIGHTASEQKIALLEKLKPQYIILKPSLIGGIRHANEWIQVAENRGIGWWATSALESNIGLNAISQWVSSYEIRRPQGLGTGGLYTNNIPAPMTIDQGKLFYHPHEKWDLSLLSLT